MQNNIVPFGKYKGQPIEAMAQDQQYITWLQGQSWFLERYQNINTLIINNFREPSETPEHNNIQAQFTDDEFVKKFIKYVVNLGYERNFNSAIYNGVPIKKRYNNVAFEQQAVDVQIAEWIELSDKDLYCNAYLIEIKPSLSDDYPAILRQMMSNKSRYLFTKEYTGTGATLEQVRKIFLSAKKFIIIQSDL